MNFSPRNLFLFFIVCLVCGIIYFLVDIPAIFALITVPLASFFKKDNPIQNDLETKEKELKVTIKEIEEQEKKIKESGVVDKSLEEEKEYWKKQ